MRSRQSNLDFTTTPRRRGLPVTPLAIGGILFGMLVGAGIALANTGAVDGIPKGLFQRDKAPVVMSRGPVLGAGKPVRTVGSEPAR
jgi:hypothetical protein